jgi:hypothetical protein
MYVDPKEKFQDWEFYSTAIEEGRKCQSNIRPAYHILPSHK